ncbi:hypothetical protein POM88_028709 [Heracleum sosnowskyi]|uniref:Exostosin GT47 domain-containing protein n=1 Tax=Heracleum sosnowskyi TaxID=360622 RepID=A0AAD8HSR4_9APIA|nr:hypothetical protein POM88_028709 [Heracleum sosnowskyi]
MSSELGRICQVETRRWVWLIAIVFALILMAQYVELPYGNIISSVLPDGRTQVSANGSSLPGIVSSYPNKSSNLTELDNLNSTRTTSIEKTDTSKITEEKNLAQESDPSLISSSTSDNPLLTSKPEDNVVPTQENGISGDSSMPPSFASPVMSATGVNLTTRDVISSVPSVSSMNNDAREKLHNEDGPGTPQSNNNSSVKERPKSKEATVLSISEMNDMLKKNRTSSHSTGPRWSSAVDQRLLDAKSQIESAPMIKNDQGLYAPLYRNASVFRRSYELMEQTLKVYIYKEGKRPIFHHPPPVLAGIYASEGWFMKLLQENKQYVTKNPNEAHLFYLPFSSRTLEETLYVPDSHSHTNLIRYLDKYLDLLVSKYPFWNRTDGADHFFVACHDWAPAETRFRFNNCIKALCNADIKEGFRLGKDASLPETMVRSKKNPLRDIGGNAPSQRPILAFFAGQMHGYLRPMLLQQWQDKDPNIKIFKTLPKSKKNRVYAEYMKSSKYCLCPKGYEVNSPRVVEAIYFECVPVIISDNFVPPFFEILNWESFAVFIPEKDLPNLKNILLSISERRYQVMQQRVKQLQNEGLESPFSKIATVDYGYPITKTLMSNSSGSASSTTVKRRVRGPNVNKNKESKTLSNVSGFQSDSVLMSSNAMRSSDSKNRVRGPNIDRTHKPTTTEMVDRRTTLGSLNPNTFNRSTINSTSQLTNICDKNLGDHSISGNYVMNGVFHNKDSQDISVRTSPHFISPSVNFTTPLRSAIIDSNNVGIGSFSVPSDRVKIQQTGEDSHYETDSDVDVEYHDFVDDVGMEANIGQPLLWSKYMDLGGPNKVTTCFVVIRSGRPNHISPSNEVAAFIVSDDSDTGGFRDTVVNSKQEDAKQRQTVSMWEYYCYKVMIRTSEALTLHLAGHDIIYNRRKITGNIHLSLAEDEIKNYALAEIEKLLNDIDMNVHQHLASLDDTRLNWTIKVRITRMWVKTNDLHDILQYHLILVDCENTQMHAIVSPELWQLFPNVIHEGSLCTITNLRVIPSFGHFRPIKQMQKMMSFLHTTVVNILPEDFVISMHRER